MNIMSKSEATKAGLDYYYTGRPCKHGHDSVRMVPHGQCVECYKAHSNNTKTLYRSGVMDTNVKLFKWFKWSFYMIKHN